MTHPAPDLLALVALGEEVDPEGVTHLTGCAACTAEVETLQQVVRVGRSLGPEDELVAPHPRVWQRIVHEVGGGQVVALARGSAPDGRRDEVVAPPERPVGPRPLQRPRWRWGVPVLAAAAALVVGLGGGFVLKGLLDPGPDVLGATQLNALPQWPGANGTAAIEQGDGGQRTLVVTVEVPAGDRADGTLEVWMSDSRATDMLPMGTLKDGSGRFPIPASVDLTAHPVVDVSLEPPGDTDPAHSNTSVVRGRVVR